jgi:hypothetical protein
MPNRRKVLIGLGTSVAVAGCSGTSETEVEPESEPEPNETETETNKTEDITNDSEEITDKDEPENEPENETEEEEVQEEEEVNKKRQKAKEKIETAKQTLEKGLEIYADYDVTGESILDVTSMNAEYEWTNVVNYVDGAEEPLDEAEEYGFKDLNDEVNTLRKEKELIEKIAEAQKEGQLAKREAVNHKGNMDGPGSNTITLNNYKNKIKNRKNNIISNVDEASNTLETISETIIRKRSIYDDKITQLKNEIEVFEAIIDINGVYKSGIETLESAESAFDNGDYSTAEFRARDAERTFNDCIDTLSEPETDLLEGLTDSYESTIDSDISDAVSLQESAARKQDN